MVDLMLKFFPTTTSHSIQGKRAVTYINFVSIGIAALIELISSNLFIIFVIDLERLSCSHELILAMMLSTVQIRWLC